VSVPPADDGARAHGASRARVMPFVAAAVIAVMALVLWVDVLWRDRLMSTIGTSGYSTTAGLVISAVALPIIIGLLLRATWAWWAGLIAAAWQLISHLLYLIVTLASGEPVGLAGWLIVALLALFLILLLLPATREACFKRDTGS